MKKLFVIIALVFSFVSLSTFGFCGELEILPRADIVKLSDQDLMKIYVQAKIEVQVYKTFSRTTFTHREYNRLRDILAFVINLRQEMQKREIDAPPIDEWING